MNNKRRIEVWLTANSKEFDAGLNRSQQGLKRFVLEAKNGDKALAAMRGSVAGVTGLLGALGAGAAVTGLVSIADKYNELDSRLRLVTDSAEELASVQDALYKQSQQTGTSYQGNIDGYFKMAVALKDAKVQQQELLAITDMVSKSLIVAGAGTDQAASFMLQFTQAVGSGVLQMQELGPMLDSNAYFGQQLAKALDTDIAGLRKMSKEGKLTTDVLRGAFPKMATEIDAAFAKMPKNVGKAVQALKNAMDRIIADADRGAEGTNRIADSIDDLAQTVDDNREGIVSLFQSLIDMAADAAKGAAWLGETIAAGNERQKNFQDTLAADAEALFGHKRGFLAAREGAAALQESYKKLAAGARLSADEQKAALGEIEAKIAELGNKRQDVQQWFAISPQRRQEKAETIASIDAEIAALGRQKDAIMAGASAHREVAEVAKKSGEEQKATAVKVTDEMTAAYKRYTDEVKRLGRERVDAERDLKSQLREMGRSGMSEKDAYYDRWREAQQMMKDARRALFEAERQARAGNDEAAKESFDAARDYAKEARAAFAGLDREVKEGDRTIIARRDATIAAMRAVKTAGELEQGIIDAQQKAAQAGADAINKESGFAFAKEKLAEIKTATDAYASESVPAIGHAYEVVWDSANQRFTNMIGEIDQKTDELVAKPREMTIDVKANLPKEEDLALNGDGNLAEELPKVAAGFAELSKQAGALSDLATLFQKGWADAWKRFMQDGERAIASVERSLEALTRDRTVKVYVDEVQRRQTGGMIGVQKMAAGGGVAGLRNLLGGGALSGFGGGDRRHAVLEDGEYVFDKWRVRDAGLDVVRDFHAGRYAEVVRKLTARLGATIHRQFGGLVNAIPALPPVAMASGGPVAAPAAAGPVYNLTVNYSGSVGTASRQNGRDLARFVASELERMHRGASR